MTPSTPSLKERIENAFSLLECDCESDSEGDHMCPNCWMKRRVFFAIEDLAGEANEYEMTRVLAKEYPELADNGFWILGISHACEMFLRLLVGKAGDKPCNQPMKSVGDIGASTCKGRNPKSEGDELIITKLPRCPHGKAFCDWAGNRTMYDGCQPTENQEKEIAIILLGNRRDFASPKIEGGEKEVKA